MVERLVAAAPFAVALVLFAMVAVGDATAVPESGSEAVTAQGHGGHESHRTRGPEIRVKVAVDRSDTCRVNVKVKRAPEGSGVYYQVRNGGRWKAAIARLEVEKGNSRTWAFCDSVAEREAWNRTSVRALLKRGRKTLARSRPAKLPQVGPPSTGSFKAVSAGDEHTCAIRADDTIVCWGDNTSGQATPPTGSFKSVSAGDTHTCAIRTDDSIVCWGGNRQGQSTPPSGSFKSVSAGVSHTCAIRTDDSIVCWGDNGSGRATPKPGSFKSVSAGYWHTCAIRTDDSIDCWGDDDLEQLQYPEDGSFKALSAGDYHNCAIRTDDTIACWGNGGFGQATRTGSFKAVSAGGQHTCAIRADDSIDCWGYNRNGQTRSPAGSFKAVSAGGLHTCAIRSDDSIACWGWQPLNDPRRQPKAR